MFKKTLLTMATVAACLGAAPIAQAAPVALFNATYGSAAGGSQLSLVYGNRFTMSSSITATALGLFDYLSNGFAETHQVGLWNATTGSLLASVSFGPGQAGALGPGVNAVGSLPNSGMRYLDIADVMLETGQSYWLAALFPPPLNDTFGLASNLSSSYASGFSGAYRIGSTLQQPTTPLGSIIGVNLLLDDGSSNGGGNSVPEPATLIQVLTLLGALALVRRRRA